jgi:hypothetical protein
MAKPLTLLNQDIAQAFRLHSITQPPAAFELTDLDKDLLQTIMDTKTSTRQKVDKFHSILHRYKNILEQYQDSNIQPNQAPPIIPPTPKPTPIKTEPKKEETVPSFSKPDQSVRSPKSKAIIDLMTILEEKDRSFNQKPGNIVLNDRDISDKVFNSAIDALKKTKQLQESTNKKLFKLFMILQKFILIS